MQELSPNASRFRTFILAFLKNYERSESVGVTSEALARSCKARRHLHYRRFRLNCSLLCWRLTKRKSLPCGRLVRTPSDWSDPIPYPSSELEQAWEAFAA